MVWTDVFQAGVMIIGLIIVLAVVSAASFAIRTVLAQPSSSSRRVQINTITLNQIENAFQEPGVLTGERRKFPPYPQPFE